MRYLWTGRVSPESARGVSNRQVHHPCPTLSVVDLLHKWTIGLTTKEDSRLHVLIQDRDDERYQVPEDVFPRPNISTNAKPKDSLLVFKFTRNPFSFKVLRRSTDEVLFDTSATPLVFESQFLSLRTALPKDPSIYGLGEHFDSFRLPNKDYTRALWARDAGVPYGQNLYGSHPVYFEQRKTGSHGVFLLNSNGMDIELGEESDEESGEARGNFLEYRAIGGVLDFYFVAGPGPVDVAKQYAEIAGTPALVPYWSLGVSSSSGDGRALDLLMLTISSSESIASSVQTWVSGLV